MTAILISLAFVSLISFLAGCQVGRESTFKQFCDKCRENHDFESRERGTFLMRLLAIKPKFEGCLCFYPEFICVNGCGNHCPCGRARQRAIRRKKGEGR